MGHYLSEMADDADRAFRALERDNAALRARVEKLEGELAREREDARDIPTIAYMSGAADWKARATRAEAQLPTRERELLDTLNMLSGARAELASVREASALLVGQEIARADKAEAERDEANAAAHAANASLSEMGAQLKAEEARVEKLEKVRKCAQRYYDKGTEASYDALGAALAECWEGE